MYAGEGVQGGRVQRERRGYVKSSRPVTGVTGGVHRDFNEKRDAGTSTRRTLAGAGEEKKTIGEETSMLKIFDSK